VRRKKLRVCQLFWIRKQLSNEAELVSYTIIKVKPKTFGHYEDYIIAIGKLKKENINIFAWLKTSDPSKIRIGMKLKLVVSERLPEKYLVYEFVPAEDL